MFGLTPDQFEILNNLLIKPLKAKNATLYVFGSRARGQHHQFSDIDIFYIEKPEALISQAEIAKIKESLEESSLPIKVDLANYNDLARSYLKSIDADKILI